MTISNVHSFLVQPAKAQQQQPEASGTGVPLKGKLFAMLDRLYKAADVDCNIDIVFSADDGKQQNPRRDQLMQYLKDPTIARARLLAQELQKVTTHRSGLGLLFVVCGQEGKNHRVLLSRFPADQGIVAQENQTNLDIQFIERVFMKTAHAYKSAFFKGISLESGFWKGRAVDKQIDGAKELSNYWIREFLRAELQSTPAAATKRLAVAIRQAINDSDVEVRSQLVSASSLLQHRTGGHISPEQLVDAFGLSETAADALRDALPRPELFNELFEFDPTEFKRQVHIRSVELDNGATVMGDNERFDQIFRSESVDHDTVRISTQGKIVDQRLRKTI